MKKNLPPLNWLRSFEASARYLSFTQAAQELNMTQAAISQQVKGLEAQLGTPLFKRLARGLELTDAGLAFLPAVREATDRLAAATEEIFGQGRNKQLTLRANLVFFTHWLAPRLHRFRERHPDVGLRFTSNIWVREQDSPTDVDMEIRYGKGYWPGLQSDRLTWDKLFPVCSPKLQRENRLDSPADLTQQTLLHVIGYEEGWEYWLKQIGEGQLIAPRGLQFDTLISAMEMAALGEGLALGRSSLVTGMLDDGRLIAPFEEAIETNEAFHLTYPASALVHPDAELFRVWILEEAERAAAQQS